MKDNKIIIETERLILRELTENDFDVKILFNNMARLWNNRLQSLLN
ncbi:hypothetical protein [Heyndrickxia oleronia]